MQPIDFTVYYESDALTIRYNLEHSVGTAVWRGKFSRTDLQEAFLICLHACEKYYLTRWLADDRKVKAYSEEEKNWIFENVIPDILTGPLRRMAVLPSEDEKQADVIEHLLERTGELGDFTVRNFTNEAEAWHWLMQEF